MSIIEEALRRLQDPALRTTHPTPEKPQTAQDPGRAHPWPTTPPTSAPPQSSVTKAPLIITGLILVLTAALIGGGILWMIRV